MTVELAESCFEYTHRWPVLGPDLVSKDPERVASAIDRLEDRDREIEAQVCCPGPAWRCRTSGDLTEDTWTQIDLSEFEDFMLGGVEVVANEVVIPRSGIYSCRWQVLAEYEGSEAAVHIAVLLSDSEGTRVDTVAYSAVTVAGSAVNVAFGANKGETLSVWAFTAEPDVSLMYDPNDSPAATLVASNAGEVPPMTEFSGHWVREGTFDRPTFGAQ